MPVISTLGAMSSRGFGEFNQQATGKYIEDYFSTWLYTGNGGSQTISNGIALADTAEWSTYSLSEGSTFGFSVTADSSGNFYSVGYANDGQRYILLAKYNSAGVLQFQKKIRQTSSVATSGDDIAVDSSGNIYVVGQAFDGTNYYLLVLKCDSSGAITWQRKLYEGESYGKGIAVDSSGNVYVTGKAVDGNPYTYCITAKYNSSGVLQWKRNFLYSTLSPSQGRSIAVDSSGNSYVLATNSNSPFILKYNTSGTLQWQRYFDGTVTNNTKIVVDSSANVYFSCKNGTNLVLVKYDTSGTYQWQRSLVSSSSASGSGVYCDASNNVYVCSAGVIAKYDSSGTLQWQRSITQGNSSLYDISGDTSGNIYAIGDFNGSTYSAVVKIKADGTTTSGTAIVSMSPTSFTSSATSITYGNGTGTDSSSSATDAAAGTTSVAGTATAASATQAAVTGAGGLVWMKGRSGATNHALYDTNRGATFDLACNTTAAQTTQATGLTAFTASGFSIGSLAKINTSSATYVSWTWRESPKFFDVVTYTGTGSAGLTINHNLGSEPGMIILKAISSNPAQGQNWLVYHRTQVNCGRLNTTDGFIYGGIQNVTATSFQPVGTGDAYNVNGVSYIAYLFAHNAGGFGLDGTQNVISCGSFSAGTSVDVSLGYEPQYVLVKCASDVSNWWVSDVMRGMSNTSYDFLQTNVSDAEGSTGAGTVIPTATGFTFKGANLGFTAGQTMIYMAIRRGPMKVPTDATTVFSPIVSSGPASTKLTTNFPVDSQWKNNRGGDPLNTNIDDRLRGTSSSSLSSGLYVITDLADGENATSGTTLFWDNTGFQFPFFFEPNNMIFYNFRRAPSFMDVVCYTGTGVARTVTHNLKAVPELIMVKRRNGSAAWWVYNATTGNTGYLQLSVVTAFTASTTAWNNTSPTSSVFTVGTASQVNAVNDTYVAYLFSSCPGVSKVGSYTGTGATQTINCGFTGGARYVMIKRTNDTGSWWVWDTARGMVAGTDPRLRYDAQTAETNTNWVYTTTGGFQIVTADADVNASGGQYIFWAVA